MTNAITTTNTATTMTVGLIAGRHPLPVNEYIFSSSIEDVFNFDYLEQVINEFLSQKVAGIEECITEDGNTFESGYDSLTVYITGLTCVTAALIKCCSEKNIPLTLMHFNNVSGEYIPQVIIPVPVETPAPPAVQEQEEAMSEYTDEDIADALGLELKLGEEINCIDYEDCSQYESDRCNNGGCYWFKTNYNKISPNEWEVHYHSSAEDDFDYCNYCGNFGHQGNDCSCYDNYKVITTQELVDIIKSTEITKDRYFIMYTI